MLVISTKILRIKLKISKEKIDEGMIYLNNPIKFTTLNMHMKTVPDSFTQVDHAYKNLREENCEISLPNENQKSIFKNVISAENINDIWSLILEKLLKLIKRTSINTWIKPCKVLSINDEEIVIAVKNEFTRKFIMQSFSEAIYKATKEVLAASIKLRLVISAETNPEQKKNFYINDKPNSSFTKSAPTKLSSVINQSELVEQKTFAEISSPTKNKNSNRNPKIDPSTGLYTQFKFKNLVISKSNLNVVTFAKAIIEENMGFHYNSLFIKSDVGLGKTHILHAVAHEALENDLMLKVKYLKAEDFLNEYVVSLKNKSYEKFKKKYRELDLLLFDEAQFLDGKTSTQQEFCNTFDAIINNGGKVILSSNQDLSSFKKIEKKLKSRIQGSLSAEILALDYNARLMVVSLKAKEMDLEISSEQKQYIAESFTENIRELEGALLKLSAFNNLSDEIGVDNASIADLFASVHVDEEKNGISINKIARVVAANYMLTSDDLKSKKRSQNIAQARHIAIYLSHELLELSYQRIGDFFGGRKHSSVIYSIKTIHDQVNSKLSNSNTLKKCLDDIRSSLRE